MKAYLHWRVHQFAKATGWPGLAAACMLLACAVLQASVLPSLRARNAALASQGLAYAPALPVRGSLPDLPSTLPPPGDYPRELVAVFDAAKRQGLQLTQGDYSDAVRAGGIAHVDLAIPLTATWPQLHGFIAEILANLPNAALGGLRVARQKSDAQQVEAQLRFRLFLQAAP